MGRRCTAYYPVQCCAKCCNATEQQACARKHLLYRSLSIFLALQSWVWVEASGPPAMRSIWSWQLVGLG